MDKKQSTLKMDSKDNNNNCDVKSMSNVEAIQGLASIDPKPMVWCRHVQFPDYRVLLTQPAPTLLRYENRLYKIDEACHSIFDLQKVHTINCTQEGLYTMFGDSHMHETWHDRWIPTTLAEVRAIYPSLSVYGTPLLEAAMSGNELDAARTARKVQLIETMLLSAMELVDMSEEDDRFSKNS